MPRWHWGGGAGEGETGVLYSIPETSREVWTFSKVKILEGGSPTHLPDSSLWLSVDSRHVVRSPQTGFAATVLGKLHENAVNGCCRCHRSQFPEQETKAWEATWPTHSGSTK